MRDATHDIPPPCAAARELMHTRLDGDHLDSADEARLASHLAGCEDCRDLEADLGALQQALRNLPELTMPAAALRDVRARTVEVPRSDRRGGAFRPTLAAAAVLAVVLLGMWQLRQPVQAPTPTRAEVTRATAEVRMVLGLMSRAIRRVEHEAVTQVLAGEVAPALREVPVRWPDQPIDSGEDTGT